MIRETKSSSREMEVQASVQLATANLNRKALKEESANDCV
jgi:hypothetical protein